MADPGLGVVMRRGQPHPEATSERRWAARLIDAALIVGVTVMCGALFVSASGDLGVGIVLAVPGYVATLVFFGVLYGCMASPGQALVGVVSLRAWTGRRVGAWRGAWRYLGVGLAPLWVVVLIADSWNAGYDEPVRVVFRRRL